MNATDKAMLSTVSKQESKQSPPLQEISSASTWNDGKPRQIEIFADRANIKRAIEDLGFSDIPYGKLVNWTIVKFKKRLGKFMASTASCCVRHVGQTGHVVSPKFCRGTIWWFTAQPKNYHPDDREFVASYERCNEELRSHEGFNVQPVPVHFHGFHVEGEDRVISANERERTWNKQDAGVDVALTTRLLRRCLAKDHPHAVLLISGDCDFTPVLREIIETIPGITVGVAAFRSRLSGVYWPGNKLGIQWPVRPIVLDDFLTTRSQGWKSRVDGSGSSQERSQR